MKNLLEYLRLDKDFSQVKTSVVVLFRERRDAIVCSCGLTLPEKPIMETAYGVIEEGSLDSVAGDNLSAIGSVVWSQRVVELVGERDPSSVAFYPIDLYVPGSRKPLSQSGYYFVDVKGRLVLDRALFDEFEGELCEECGNWRRAGKARFGAKVKCPVLDRDYLPWFALSQNIRSAEVYCRLLFADIVVQEGLTGFAFGAMAPGLGRLDVSADGWKQAYEQSVKERYPELAEHL